MSRYLCQALGLDEPKFRHALMALERRSGHPNNDLRLASTLATSVRQKLKELDLDPDDTTAEELYHSLNHKLTKQETSINKKLRYLAAKQVNAEANVSDGLTQFAKKLLINEESLALKPSVLKRQLKTQLPKKAMRALNYRSIDSMLKLEPMALIMLAVNSFESEGYLNKFYAQYKSYSASDFEMRPISVLSPKAVKWQKLLTDISNQTGLKLVSSYELGSIVLMPVGNNPEVGHLSLILADLLSELLLMQTVSNYLRVQQVSPDFGLKLSSVVTHEPYLDIKLLDHPVTWRSVQKVLHSMDAGLNLPHVNLEELTPDKLLARGGELLSELKFWLDSESLGLVRSDEVTSLNLNDVARNVAYQLPFSKRELKYFQSSLHRELTKQYLDPEQLVENVLSSTNERALV